MFRKSRNVPIISYGWLFEQWREIWDSTNVSISEVPITDCRGLSLYTVGQYFSKQPVLRMSYGRRWTGQGVKKRFIHLCEVYGTSEQSRFGLKTVRGEIFPRTKLASKNASDGKNRNTLLGLIGFEYWNCTPSGSRYRLSSFQSFLNDQIYVNPKVETVFEENHFVPINTRRLYD